MEKQGNGVRKFYRWQSIRVKFLLSYLFITLGVLAVMNFYPVFTSQNSVFRMKQSSVENQASVVASALSGLGIMNKDEVNLIMDQLDTSGLNRVIVTDDSGLILYDTSENEDTVGSYSLLPEVVQALRGKDVFHSEYTSEAFRSKAAVPVIYRGVLMGCVYVYDYDSDQAQLLVSLQARLRNVSVVFVLAAAALSVFMTGSLASKVAKLLQGIQKQGVEGEAQKVDIGGHDEISVLADEFNLMTDRLQETEQVRRRFVSDASHELKTPLASIRLLSDSILQTENMDDGTIREFVGDIGDEADRLTRITQKLLTLTRLDARAENKTSEINVKDIADKVYHMLMPLADEKQVSLHFICQSDIVLNVNGDDLYQILFNLAENAVKYNVQNGSVTLKVEEQDSETCIIVEDTGIGIPDEDLPLIFQRFYRVDKARSREAGGTGLGLSIVHDMVARYHGTVSAECRPEGGSRFIVIFPQEVSI